MHNFFFSIPIASIISSFFWNPKLVHPTVLFIWWVIASYFADSSSKYLSKSVKEGLSNSLIAFPAAKSSADSDIEKLRNSHLNIGGGQESLKWTSFAR